MESIMKNDAYQMPADISIKIINVMEAEDAEDAEEIESNLPRILQCFAEKKNNVWSAVCVDLTLGAQGDTFEEAKEKLEAQVYEYIFDALYGEDTAHTAQLLRRKSPINMIIWYQYAKAMHNLKRMLYSNYLRRGYFPREYTRTSALNIKISGSKCYRATMVFQVFYEGSGL